MSVSHTKSKRAGTIWWPLFKPKDVRRCRAGYYGHGYALDWYGGALAWTMVVR